MEKFCVSILNCSFIFVKLNNADMMKLVLKIIMGCVLGQHDETGNKEHVIYYLSKKFTDC